MKSMAELEAIRQKTLENIAMRSSMSMGTAFFGSSSGCRACSREKPYPSATCGIAAGARPVMLAFMDEIAKRHLDHVTVSQTGCAGMCRLEPMVDVYVPGQEKVTYVKLTPEMVPRIVTEHIVNGRTVEEYTIGAAEANK